jgi:hypothetical protein
MGLYDEAENIYREIPRNLAQVLGPDHSRLLITMNSFEAL